MPAKLPGIRTIWLGNCDGTFQPAQSNAASTYRLVAADFNGDGLLDLAAIGGSSLVNILLGNGDGTFQAAQDYYVAPAFGGSLVVGDFNGDGLPDLAAGGYASAVLLNSP